MPMTKESAYLLYMASTAAAAAAVLFPPGVARWVFSRRLTDARRHPPLIDPLPACVGAVAMPLAAPLLGGTGWLAAGFQAVLLAWCSFAYLRLHRLAVETHFGAGAASCE